jgi:hypothetical protein
VSKTEVTVKDHCSHREFLKVALSEKKLERALTLPRFSVTPGKVKYMGTGHLTWHELKLSGKKNLKICELDMFVLSAVLVSRFCFDIGLSKNNMDNLPKRYQWTGW